MQETDFNPAIDRAKLLAIDELFKNMLRGLIGQVLVIIFVAITVKDFIPLNYVIIGVLTQLFIFTIRIYIIKKYQKIRNSFKTYAQAKKYLRFYIFTVALTGFLWGSLVFFVESFSKEYHFLVYAILIVLIYASIMTIGIVMNIYVAFALPIMSMLFASFIMSDDYISQVSALFVIVAYVYAHATVKRFSQSFITKVIDDALLKKHQEELKHIAHHDFLTGQPNRVLFHDRLDRSISMHKRNAKIFALFFIDLDYFKHINDTHGHEVGDKVLVEITKKIRSIIREADTLSRLGGDEFTLIMNELTSQADAILIAKKMLELAREPIVIDSNALHISLSIGISLYPRDADNSRELLAFADDAMYKTKQNGKNSYTLYNDIISS